MFFSIVTLILIMLSFNFLVQDDFQDTTIFIDDIDAVSFRRSDLPDVARHLFPRRCGGSGSQKERIVQQKGGRTQIIAIRYGHGKDP